MDPVLQLNMVVQALKQHGGVRTQPWAGGHAEDLAGALAGLNMQGELRGLPRIAVLQSDAALLPSAFLAAAQSVNG